MTKVECRAETNRAIRHGIIQKSAGCEQCGSNIDVQCHHRDYTDPLNVIWLCHDCHQTAHSTGEHTCMRCGHIWKARKKIPKACPFCKQYGWQKKSIYAE